MNVAVVGCGRMGTHHARVVRRDPTCRLVGVVDIVPERERALAEAVGAPAGVGERPDVVIVATDTSAHVEVARRWLAEGAWCLVEKPLAATREEALALSHPRCLVGHSERFNPAVRSASVGRLQEAMGERFVPADGRALDVDVVSDLLVHDLDLWTRWAGPLRCASARGRRAEGRWVEVDVALEGVGFRGRLRAGRGPASRRLSARDQHGDFRIDHATGTAWRSGAPVPAPADDALTAQWQALRQAVRGERHPLADAEQALAVLGLADAVRSALQETR